MKKNSLILIALFLSSVILAQNYEDDALKYSQMDLYATARSVGAGGAFSSVGADISNVGNNPAGIGLFRMKELSATLGYNFGQSKSTYLNENSSSYYGKFQFPQAGLVLTSNLKRTAKNRNFNQSKLNFINVAIGYNRLAEYNRSYSFQAQNNYNSFTDPLVSEINSTTDSITFDYYSPAAVLAYNGYLLNPDSNGLFYSSVSHPVIQSGTIRTKGGMDEINLAVAGNIDDKVFFGVGVGIPWISYQRDYYLKEDGIYSDSVSQFKNFSYQNSYRVYGAGVNLKAGVIAKPFPWWRLGVYMRTPSWFSLEENNTAELQSTIFGTTYNPDKFSANLFKYSLYTPWRAGAGTSFFFKQYGFISVDYELADYNHTRFNFKDFPTDTKITNDLIHAKYKLGHQVRVGAEASISKLRLRAGFVWTDSPFKSGIAVKNYDNSSLIYTAGIGYRGKNFFADIAYAYTKTRENFTPYFVSTNEPSANFTLINQRVLATIGFKFGK